MADAELQPLTTDELAALKRVATYASQPYMRSKEMAEAMYSFHQELGPTLMLRLLAQLAAAETAAAQVAALLVKAEMEVLELRDRLRDEQRATAKQEVQALALVQENEKLRTVRDKLSGVFGQLLFVGPSKDPVELQMQVRYELAQIVHSLGLKSLPTGHTYPSYIIDQYNQFNPGSPVLGKVAPAPLAPPASAPVAPVAGVAAGEGGHE